MRTFNIIISILFVLIAISCNKSTIQCPEGCEWNMPGAQILKKEGILQFKLDELGGHGKFMNLDCYVSYCLNPADKLYEVYYVVKGNPSLKEYLKLREGLIEEYGEPELIIKNGDKSLIKRSELWNEAIKNNVSFSSEWNFEDGKIKLYISKAVVYVSFHNSKI